MSNKFLIVLCLCFIPTAFANELSSYEKAQAIGEECQQKTKETCNAFSGGKRFDCYARMSSYCHIRMNKAMSPNKKPEIAIPKPIPLKETIKQKTSDSNSQNTIPPAKKHHTTKHKADGTKTGNKSEEWWEDNTSGKPDKLWQ